MFVVDTNIIAALYVRGSYSDAVKQLHGRDQVWRTDPFALIELSNILATYERARYLTKALARERLADAQDFLRPHYFAVTHDLRWKWLFATGPRLTMRGFLPWPINSTVAS